MFMEGTAYELFRRYFGRKLFVIRLLCITFKEKLKIQEHRPLRIDFGFTTTYIMIVYENVLTSGTN